MQQDTPNYTAWTRADLITETTRLALSVEEAENRQWTTRALQMRERYHLAMAALIELSSRANAVTWPGQDAHARRRVRITHQQHIAHAEAARRQRLGMDQEVPA